MASHPTVSVLIPCYNAERYIGETLKSVFRQTWPQLEIIVVDDGSSDNSAGVVRHFATSEQRLRLIKQENTGASAARNRAFAASRGEFIQFLDADDLIDPEKIELQIARLAGLPRCVASAEWGRFYEPAKKTNFEPEPVWRDLDPLTWLALSRAEGFGMMFPALWLIPRAVVDAAGPWDETLSLGDDSEYFTRVLLAAERVLFCHGARCHYRSGLTDSLSGRKSIAAWASQFRATELCETHVRAREDSERIRRSFALSWQHLAHACYPYDPECAARALARGRAMHSITIRPGGGHSFRLLSRMIGWRAARRLHARWEERKSC